MEYVQVDRRTYNEKLSRALWRLNDLMPAMLTLVHRGDFRNAAIIAGEIALSGWIVAAVRELFAFMDATRVGAFAAYMELDSLACVLFERLKRCGVRTTATHSRSPPDDVCIRLLLRLLYIACRTRPLSVEALMPDESPAAHLERIFERPRALGDELRAAIGGGRVENAVALAIRIVKDEGLDKLFSLLPAVHGDVKLRYVQAHRMRMSETFMPSVAAVVYAYFSSEIVDHTPTHGDPDEVLTAASIVELHRRESDTEAFVRTRTEFLISPQLFKAAKEHERNCRRRTLQAAIRKKFPKNRATMSKSLIERSIAPLDEQVE